MSWRQNKIDLGCKGCASCKHYPYFHYVPERFFDTGLIKTEKPKKVFDIELIKFDKNHSEVINHTTGVTHIYNGIKHEWKQKK